MKIKSIILILFLFLPFPALANTITKLKKGDKAPYSGFLLTTEALLKIKIKPKHQKELYDQKFKHQKEFNDEKIKNIKKNHQIEIISINGKHKSIMKIKDEEIRRLRQMTLRPSGPNLVPQWITIGILGGAAMTVAVVYALQPTK